MSNETKAAGAATTGRTKTGMSSRVRFITVTAMLSAISFVLMYFEFPIPIMPAFIKFDFSDLPALIGTFAYGPLCGVIVCLIKNLLLHLQIQKSCIHRTLTQPGQRIVCGHRTDIIAIRCHSAQDTDQRIDRKLSVVYDQNFHPYHLV